MTPEPDSSCGLFLPVAVVLGGLMASMETTAGSVREAICSKRSLRACRGSAELREAGRVWADALPEGVETRLEPPKKAAIPNTATHVNRFIGDNPREGWSD